MVVTVRIWLTHSVVSTAPALCQVATPFSSRRPTVFSQSLRPLRAPWASNRTVLVKPDWVRALRTELLIVTTAVSLAQSASRFQTPQPPIDCRDHPDSGYLNPEPRGIGDE